MIKKVIDILKKLFWFVVLTVGVFVVCDKADKKELDKIRKDIYEKDIDDVVDSINSWLS